jgi:sulfur carrier protein
MIILNGRLRELSGKPTVEVVVQELAGPEPRGVAVAVNGEVVPRSAWAATALRDGDVVEVLTAAQGG